MESLDLVESCVLSYKARKTCITREMERVEKAIIDKSGNYLQSSEDKKSCIEEEKRNYCESFYKDRLDEKTYPYNSLENCIKSFEAACQILDDAYL